MRRISVVARFPSPNSCSQIRTTLHPRLRNARVTHLSRAIFPAIFPAQNRFPVLTAAREGETPVEPRPLSLVALRVIFFPPPLALFSPSGSCLLAPDFDPHLLLSPSAAIELFLNHLAGLECFGHPCQKQPSTKTATRCLGKTKSGFPISRWFRRQPEMWLARNNFASASSVSLLPLPRIRDITSDRFRLVNTSGI